MKRTLALVVVLVLIAPVSAGNWSRFRGPNGTGVADNQNLPITFDKTSGILWKVPIPGTGNASPIVWNDRVFIHAALPNERVLMCLDVADGRTVWSKRLPGTTAKFRGESSLASSTPATDGTIVVVAFWDGRKVHLAAYDFAGNRKWLRDLGPWFSQHGPGHSPILYKDKVILAHDMDKEDKEMNPVERPSILMALNKATGDTLWETPREANRSCYSAPVFLERPGRPLEMIVTSTTGVTSYNPDDGKPYWEWHWKFTGKMPLRTITTPIHVDGTFLVTSGDGGGDRHMSAIDLRGGNGAQPVTAWENKKDFPYVPSMLSRGEHVYFVNERGMAGCFHKSGKRIWFERIPGATFFSSPVLVDGKMYAASVEGDLFVIAAEPTFQILGKSSLDGEMVRASLAVADGRLYIRGARHLYCIGNAKR